LLVYHNLPPVKIGLRLWFEDKELRRRRDGFDHIDKRKTGA